MTLLSTPAIISALGVGISPHLQGLWSSETESPLQRSQEWIADKDFLFGSVNIRLRNFPVKLATHHHSRNNQLLWTALEQIEPVIEAAIARYGRNRIATIIGTSTSGVDDNIDLFQAAARTGNWQALPFKQQQQCFSAPADFVADVYQLSGLQYGISTACTSGARALISAARLLKLGICDAVICGGVDTLSPLTIQGFHALEVLSDELSRPFSATRKGINIGEAAAAFVMSRETIGDHSLPLLGYGSSSDAYHMSSPQPEGLGAIQAIEAALQHAQLPPEAIGWINLHGTGTLLNDSMESLAIAKVFGTNTPVTATKPLTGHTLGAAGALEAALLWLIVSRETNPMGKLPAQYHHQADPNLPPLAFTHHDSYWQQTRRIAASTSFAFGGNNSVIIIGEAVC